MWGPVTEVTQQQLAGASGSQEGGSPVGRGRTYPPSAYTPHRTPFLRFRFGCGQSVIFFVFLYFPVSAHQLHLSPQGPPVPWARPSPLCLLLAVRASVCSSTPWVWAPTQTSGGRGAPVVGPCTWEAQSHSHRAFPGSRAGSLGGGRGLLGAAQGQGTVSARGAGVDPGSRQQPDTGS